MPRRNLFKIIMIVCLTGLLVVPSVTAQIDPACDNYFNYPVQGAELLRGEDYVLAVEAYTCAIELDSETAENYYWRGIALVAIGQYEAAITDLDYAYENLPISSNSLGALYYLGKAYAGLNQGDEAIQHYSTVIKQAPEYIYGYIDRGITYINLGDHDAAMADFDRAIELEPDNGVPYLARGWAYAMLYEYEAAAADLSHAVELDDGFTESSFNLKFGVATIERYLEAVEELNAARDALAADPDSAIRFIQRGISYFRLSNLKAAVDDFNEAINLDDTFAKAYYYRGLAWAYQQEHEAAAADYSRVIELDPDYPQVYIARGTSAIVLQEFEQAVQDYEHGLEMIPDPSPGMYLTYGDALLKVGRDADAASNFLSYINGIRYNTFNRVLAVNDTMYVLLGTGDVYHIRFTAEAGQYLKFSAYAAFDNLPLDPLIVLLSPNGTALAGNDDQINGDVFSALIKDFEVPEAGEYTLLLTHAGGLTDGTVAVSIQTAR
jgi:tetratricopeptide (TPR) repeat protein